MKNIKNKIMKNIKKKKKHTRPGKLKCGCGKGASWILGLFYLTQS